MMKKIVSLLLATVVMSVMLAGCSGKTDSQMISDSGETDKTEEILTSEQKEIPSVSIKTSPDKYTWYIKNYVGKNCATVGYSALSGNRMDSYGAGYIKLVFVASTGAYINVESDDDLKQYVVTAQSVAPNTELKYTFTKDSEGNEYDNLVSWQSCEEIVLCVKKVGSNEEMPSELTEITSSSDKYTWYIRDYKGRNLANCGYLSIAGEQVDQYGAGYIQFVIVPEDGTFIDPEDTELMKNYVVTGQNIEPNTELTYTFMQDSEGNEYDNLIQTQNIEEIELYVKLISDQ